MRQHAHILLRLAQSCSVCFLNDALGLGCPPFAWYISDHFLSITVSRNFGKQIVGDDGTLLGFEKKPKWSDLLLAVPRWFSKHAPAGSGDSASKVYSHYQSIAPTVERGPKKFILWIKQLSELLQEPLPLASWDASWVQAALWSFPGPGSFPECFDSFIWSWGPGSWHVLVDSNTESW